MNKWLSMKMSEGRMVPKGLRVKLPTSILKSEYGERLKMSSEKRVVKRAISDLFIKIKRLDKRLAEIRLHLNQSLGFTNAWIQKMERWVKSSLGKSEEKIKKRLERKLKDLRLQKKNNSKPKMERQTTVKKKIVYNNSLKKLTEEQMELLALGLILD